MVAATAEQGSERLEQALLTLRNESWPTAPVAEVAPGCYLSSRPLGGELAVVFTGPAGAYPAMGREQVLAFPELVTELSTSCTCLGQAAGWVYDPEVQRAEPHLTPHQKLWGSSFLSQFHLQLCRQTLALEPSAALGFCSGESNALFAFGAWRDMDAMFDELCSAEVFSRQLGGSFVAIEQAWRHRGLIGPDEPVQWENWRLLVPQEHVAAATADQPLVHLTIVNAPGDVVIGGQAAACQHVVAAVGRHRAYRLGYDVAIHCPEMEGYQQIWRRLHHRRTYPVSGVRFYSSFWGDHYQPTADRAADALVGMALNTVDFPNVVQKAWADGVRAFIELGPRDGCSKWVSQILGDREHLSVALDRSGRNSLHQLIDATAQLVAAGLPVDQHRLWQRIEAATVHGGSPISPSERTRRYPAHPKVVQLPPLHRDAAAEQWQPDDAIEVMEPAPWLPPVLDALVPGRTVDSTSVPGAEAGTDQPPPTAGATTQPLGNPPATEAPWPAPLRQAIAHHERVAAMHREVLARQAEVHQHFLAQTARSLERLGAAARDTPPSPTVACAKPAHAEPAEHSGPAFDRRQLETLASGKISSVFGPLFASQDSYKRQVRLPEPPLLLVDRVTGIAAEPGSMGDGTIWTETDVGADAWYLDDGVMPAGIMVESGQADLLLISWLGVDLVNQGERAYRLLGCDLTYSGGLPRTGDTLRYDIHVDGHANAGPVRLFFFHYDCHINGERCLSVRNGQAGFFTDRELAESSGILWDPESPEAMPSEPARVDPPQVQCTRTALTAAQVQAFAEGRVWECFGPGYDAAKTHSRTPKIQSGKLQLIEQVTHFEP
ncbi:MAG: beta-ketoacyl synthase, partial [Deltaproteobacteria bacterium]